VLERPFLLAPHTLSLAWLPANLTIKAARVTLLTHRVVSLIVAFALAGSAVWRRRAKA